MLTNFEKWNVYTSGLSSPQNYIDWAWYYTISATLQRRVWMGPTHQPCFPNMYCILVGAPGIGKGLVIREVSDFLKFWPLEVAGVGASSKTPEEKAMRDTTNAVNLQQAQEKEYQGSSKTAGVIKPTLIPVCADAITYEALVQAVGDSYRAVNYLEWSEKQQKEITKTYGHSSLCFSLQELASLLRKRTNDTINYLLGLYDCPVDYEYTTLTRGKDRIRRGCLNLLAGTTPSFMQSTFDEKLIDEGFASRTFYIFANKNRANRFWIPALSDTQKEHKTHLLQHIKNLTQIYGSVAIEPETAEFLQEWWDKYEKNKAARANKSLKMIPYYSRKNIHVMKVAMAMHFSESVLMKIPLETFQRAIEFLEREELNMHLAITLEGTNPEAKVAKKILELLGTGRKNFVDLYVECHGYADQKLLESSLSFLQLTNQVMVELEHDEQTDKDTTYWRLV